MAHKNWLTLSLIIMSLTITSVFASGLQEGDEFIHQAVVNGDIDAVKYALELGLVDTQNQLQWTPLHAAVKNNQKEICKLLVENGADVNAQDRDGQTPLHYAVESGQKDTIAFLVENEANLNITNNRGESPLSLAEMIMNREVADILVSYGAEASNQQVTNNGQMPGGNRGQMQQGDMTQGRGNRGQMQQGDMTQGRGNRGQMQQGDMTQGRGNRGQMQQGDMTQGRGNRGQMQQFDNQGFQTQDDMTMQATDSLLEPAEALDAESAMESERITEISLSDPNEISARIATYEGLAKEIADTADRSRVGMRQWRETDDNRSTIALAIERQLGTEYEFLIPIAEQENAIQTKEKLETLCDVRARWVRVVRSDLSQQAREERAAARTTAAVRSRTTSSSTSETETEPEFDTSMWLNADVESSSGRMQLAEEVNAEILAEYNTIYVIAVEEGANKTIAAMQGLLLARNMRYDEVYANLNQQIENEAANPQDTNMQQMDAMGAPGATRGRTTRR